jgi:hypothetical protein
MSEPFVQAAVIALKAVHCGSRAAAAKQLATLTLRDGLSSRQVLAVLDHFPASPMRCAAYVENRRCALFADGHERHVSVASARCRHGHVCLVNAGHLLHPLTLDVCDLGAAEGEGDG